MATPQNTRIRHTVVFKLNHPSASPQEQAFLDAARKLSSIPGVENFECLRQVGAKNKFTFGLSMEFANQDRYDAYNHHPEHTAFVQSRWLREVDDFMEIDYVVMP